MIETSRNTVEFSQNVWRFIKVKELDLKEKKKQLITDGNLTFVFVILAKEIHDR